ncbi:MAG: Chromosome partition protein Smc [Candidatus Methanofastidiosum methylothiophilum]|uniref:Chromosome partition protein Smc n=1 Tax=Candidatus Methanofastidiosum methylothiophilum TaxID=1705564 RepID=A0A150ITH6_9EURY|nr:MAG: Chromosome partition protein Smc [Candidatus Methanofastidiosum methylthiophilus]KYC48222.1 MAG: Chromosome partition protein Smc [Candidatus Methanofastidiosum methylthiophilus]KYC50879.1 MAG: Chromosome partition protein Smc [Candidatus Methanofastidiosum methylthiophilus]
MFVKPRGGSIVFIEKVTMKGFKSYGNKTLTLPLSKGFTCIVGPNGSGKSNITDAICFVVGRISAKSMRGERLSDLIFNGTEDEKKAEEAIVSITFNNEDGGFPIEEKKVTISRAVNSKGEGEYRVNGKRATRSYVLDIFSYVGIRPDGHNIVMQGDIAHFINMNPVDRRGIIEEISGIAEFDDKKEKGLRELEKAQENITRVELVISEVKNRLDRLLRDKKDAERYQVIDKEIKHKWAIYYHSKLRELEDKKIKLESNIEKGQKDIEELRGAVSKIIQDIANKEKELLELDDEYNRKMEMDSINITREIEKIKGNILSINQSIDYEKKELSSLKKEIDETNNEIAENELKIKELSQNKANLEKESAEVEILIKNKEAEYRKLLDTLSGKDGMFLKIKESLLEADRKLEKNRKEYLSLSKELDSYNASVSILEQDRIRITSDIKKIEDKLSGIEKKLKDNELSLINYESNIKNNTNEIISLNKNHQSLKSELSQIESDSKQSLSQFENLKARINVKKEAQNDITGGQKAIAEILKAKKDKLIPGIYGTISELGTTKEEYSVALEVAAGSRLTNIVVEDDNVARECVKFLKNLKAGRATFLPLNKLVTPKISNAPKTKGVVGLAIELVSFDEKFRKAFEYVFGRTYIIDNIDVSKTIENTRLVTLDGDLVESTGAITGGYYTRKKFSVSFNIEEDTLSLKDLEKKLSEYDLRKQSVKKEIEKIEEILGNLSIKKAEFSSEITNLTREKEELTKEKNSLNKEKLSFEKSIDEITKKLEKQKSLASDTKIKIDAFLKEISALEKEKANVEKGIEDSSKGEIGEALEIDLKDLRSKYSEISSQISSINSTLEYLNQTNTKFSEKIVSRKPQEEILLKKISELEGSLKETNGILKEKENDDISIKKELSSFNQKKKSLATDTSNLRIKKDTKTEKISKLESDLNLWNSEKRTLIEDIAEFSRHASDYETPQEFSKTPDKVKIEIESLEKEREKLMPINMRAIIEYEEEEGRYNTLKLRRDTLLEEKNAILNFIGEVEKEKSEVFLKTFNEIASNFSEIFSEISPDGTAQLLLETEGNPFDGGIIVDAKPLGKNVKTAVSLSGGEKAITALSLIFAIQRYKPSPFYILDEVDANLDDSNVERTADMIKRQAEKTQFIVITLREGMMSRAERLFGVSMYKKGLSSMVALEVEKVVKQEEALA